MALHPTDIWGLDLVLGGGIQGVPRLNQQESTTILLRGPPGTGKTIVGAHIASALARDTWGHVAYACIELLPSELQFQLKRFRPLLPPVMIPPFSAPPPEAILAGVLDRDEGSFDSFGKGVLGLLDEVERVGGRPKVLVIDSLSNGYGLGGGVPRSFADELCKLAAAQGLFLILLEESIDNQPTSWAFAADVVIELSRNIRPSASDTGTIYERQITIQKNRFGSCEIGPHTLVLEARGVRVWPNPGSYASIDLSLPIPKNNTNKTAPRWPIEDANGWPPFWKSISAVYGPDTGKVFDTALALGGITGNRESTEEREIFLDLGRQTFHRFEQLPNHDATLIVAGHPSITAAELLFETFLNIKKTLAQGSVRRLLIGDCRALRSYSDAGRITKAMSLLAVLLKQWEIPVVFFETVKLETIPVVRPYGPKSQLEYFDRFPEIPFIVDFADVVISVEKQRNEITVMDVRSGNKSSSKITATPDRAT